MAASTNWVLSFPFFRIAGKGFSVTPVFTAFLKVIYHDDKLASLPVTFNLIGFPATTFPAGIRKIM